MCHDAHKCLVPSADWTYHISFQQTRLEAVVRLQLEGTWRRQDALTERGADGAAGQDRGGDDEEAP